MAAITEKSKVLHYFKIGFNVLTSKKQPTANIIDGNVQLHILSVIPDNFQGVTEIRALTPLFGNGAGPMELGKLAAF